MMLRVVTSTSDYQYALQILEGLKKKNPKSLYILHYRIVEISE